METRPIFFLEGYKEVAVAGGNSHESVLFSKDGENYSMNVDIQCGKRNGNARIADFTGITKETVVYKNGRLNGVCAHHYHNGMIRMECTVVNDVLEGEFTEYDETGKVICSGKYVNGQRVEAGMEEEEEFYYTDTPLIDPDEEGGPNDEEGGPNDEGESSSGFGAAAAGAAAAAATGAATGAAGATAALLGFGSSGVAAGSAAASMMSAAWTSGIGTGFVSAAQSAGALFMNAAGGSVLAAGAAVAAPIVAGVGVAALYRRYRKKKTPEKRDE